MIPPSLASIEEILYIQTNTRFNFLDSVIVIVRELTVTMNENKLTNVTFYKSLFQTENEKDDTV